MRFTAIVLGLLAAFLPEAALPQAPSGDLPTFLQQMAFAPYDLEQLHKGNVVVKMPRTAETREVVVFAIMHLAFSADYFVDHVRDIVNFSKSDHVLQAGKFSSTPWGGGPRARPAPPPIHCQPTEST
jgi:hypothetical protein